MLTHRQGESALSAVQARRTCVHVQWTTQKQVDTRRGVSCRSKCEAYVSRLKFVESQMGSMQGALQELLQLQRAAIPSSQQQPTSQLDCEYLPRHLLTPARTALNPQQTFAANGYPTPQAMLALQTLFNPVQGQAGPSTIPPTPTSVPWPPMFQQPPVLQQPLQQQTLHQQPIHQPPPLQPPAPQSSRLQPPSRVPSDPSDDDDEDEDPMTNNTHRDWDNMFYLAEAARLEQDGHVGPGEKEAEPSLLAPALGKRRMTNTSESSNQRRKRSKMTADLDFAEVKRNLPLQRGDFVRNFQDCIELGYCDEATARDSFRSYVELEAELNTASWIIA